MINNLPGNREVQRLLPILLALMTLSGCAAHSFPISNRFVYPLEADCGGGEPCIGKDAAQVFADTNGTFYPSGWQAHVHPRMSKKRPGEGRWLAGSLLAHSVLNPRFRRLIERDEARQLGELEAFGARHKRIFILVHGYNASVEETNIPFSAVEASLDLKPGDGVIRFYWDGLIGKGVGALKVWLDAANHSQTVGARGLRDILNQIEGREVYLIAHSRGASVVMSAFGNPVYNSKFLAKAHSRGRSWGKAYRTMLAPKPLIDRGNSFHILMLAPAIDRIDFCDASEQPVSSKGFVCSKFRALGPQVKSFAYTVNPGDPILGKLFLSYKAFNPTGLGYQADVGRSLQSEHYALFKEYAFEKPEGFHGFKDYAAHPVFLQMLNNAGIGRRPFPLPTEPLLK